MQTSDRDLAGTVVDRYRVVRSIGTGTMGNVYEAEHAELGNRVALKVLQAQHQGSEAAARFLREGKTLGLFRHRNIVELLEVGRADDGTLFLTTELIRGVSLRDLIKDGTVEPRRALNILRQIVEALGAAHAVGVIHRDVKPENIMLADGGSEDGTDLVKVLDFGVAKLVADTAAMLGEKKLTRVGMSVFGSAPYIAPEIAVGGAVDGRADLYSAGVILFEMLTGKPPFDADDPGALLRLHVSAPVPTLEGFPPALQSIVADALAKTPDARFRSASEMITAIDSALASIDVPSLSSLAPIVPAAEPAMAAEPAIPSHTDPMFVQPAVATPSKVAMSAPVSAVARVGRGSLKQRVRLLVREHTLIVGAVGGTLLLVIILALALTAGDDDQPAAARRGKQTPQELLALGHSRFESGRRDDALAAYEQAIRAAPSLGKDETLRSNTTKAIEGKDAVTAVIALELATQLRPPANDAIIATASTSKTGDVRRRAFAIAEREGFADKVDAVESWSLDLQQAATCDDRRLAIDKLAASGDKRALPALKKAKAHKCVEREAADAITRIEATAANATR